MATCLENMLKRIKQEEAGILEKINQRNKGKRIECQSCDKYHKIKDLDLIQTHYYIPPRGCTEGDYWREGELQYICPASGVRNRILFNIDYEERENYDRNPEKQFKKNYKRLFKSVVDMKGETQGKWVNNYFIDGNRKKFGLPE